MTNKFTNIKDRVLQLAEILDFGKKKFCEQIGMTYSNFTGKAKETPLNSTAIANILAIVPNVNIEWLITGQGEMLKDVTTSTPEPTVPTHSDIDTLKDFYRGVEKKRLDA